MDGVTQFLSTTPGILTAVVVMFAAGFAIFGLDSRKEERRQRALTIAQKLAGLGFKRLPEVFNAYAIGDYSGLFTHLHELREVLTDPVQRQAEFANVVKLLIEEKLKDPVKLAELTKLIEQAKAAIDSGNPLAASGDLAQQALAVANTGVIGNRLLNMEDSPFIPKIDGKLDVVEDLLKKVLEKVQPAAVKTLGVP